MRPRKQLLIGCLEYVRDILLLIAVTFSLAIIGNGIVDILDRIFR